MDDFLKFLELMVCKSRKNRIKAVDKPFVFGLLFGFEPEFVVVIFKCSRRDLNPGCGVESPTSLAELDDRSTAL